MDTGFPDTCSGCTCHRVRGDRTSKIPLTVPPYRVGVPSGQGYPSRVRSNPCPPVRPGVPEVSNTFPPLVPTHTHVHPPILTRTHSHTQHSYSLTQTRTHLHILSHRRRGRDGHYRVLTPTTLQWKTNSRDHVSVSMT